MLSHRRFDMHVADRAKPGRKCPLGAIQPGRRGVLRSSGSVQGPVQVLDDDVPLPAPCAQRVAIFFCARSDTCLCALRQICLSRADARRVAGPRSVATALRSKARTRGETCLQNIARKLEESLSNLWTWLSLDVG
jgi:hypothetical protein